MLTRVSVTATYFSPLLLHSKRLGALKTSPRLWNFPESVVPSDFSDD
jgi:hypothetical protein